MAPKIAVIFYSTYGTNYAMAHEAAEAAKAAGAEVRLRRIRETAPPEVVASQEAWKTQAEKQEAVEEASLDDLDWADGIFFSVPTRFGGMASQARAFIDTFGPLWQKGGLVNKTVTGVTSAQNPNGGQETTLQNLYISAMHWGAILVPPGYADPVKFEDGGNPYGFSTTAGNVDDLAKRSIAYQAKRLVEITAKIAG